MASRLMQGDPVQSVGMAPGKSAALVASIYLGVTCQAPARAGDTGGAGAGLRMPDPLLSLRDMYPDIGGVTAARPYTREYRPRALTAPMAIHDAPVRDPRGELKLTSSWQRLSEFRSANGIRLLTLWQAAAGTIALHEGKHGSTTLQWTSHDFSRGAATRGLFDHLVTMRSGPTP